MATMYPTWGKSATIEQIRAMATFTSLHPKLQERIGEMMLASDGRVGLGQGFRSEGEQRAMFLDRYVEDPRGRIQWNGRRWRHVKGATAAPPGRSMHELGLAADMAGDHAWVVANCSRFGLLHFAFVNNEPWHVQPFELPKSRRDYERMGAPWKGAGAVAGKQSGAATVEIVPEMRGPVVLELQELLIDLGLIKDTVANRDQYYGPGMQKVIRDFQQKHGLRADAKVGPKTWAALRGTSQA